ncbi:MAG: S41 family peptidase [Gemmatimonadota bacterium]|nr:S41 family peptidase [Gemmatimonadota bacterium]
MTEGRTRPKTIVLSGILGVALIAGAWVFQRGTTSVRVNGSRLFSQVSAAVTGEYVDTVTKAHAYQLAIDGMLSQLNDPYDAYLDADRANRLAERTSGSYAGIGLQVDVRDGSLVVVNPLPGGPGDKAGILTGDRIAQIDGKSVTGWTPEEVQKLLRGAPGSSVEIAVLHPGAVTPVTLKLTRAAIHHSAIRRAALLQANIGYVALSVFSDSTARELTTTVDSLVKLGATSLVLDLRANPGGLLDQGVAVADLFLNRGDRVASTAGRDSVDAHIYTDSIVQRWPNLTVALLVDNKSASAAEVVAGALQDHDRAVVLGMTTYGKGSVQHVFPVPAGGALRLTTARWLTPLGRYISSPPPSVEDNARDSAPPRPKYHTPGGRTVLGGGGITPDVTIPDTAASAENLAFMRALGTGVSHFHDALTGYALSLKASGAIKSPGFVVTKPMLDEIYKRMEARSVTVPRSTYDAAAPLVSRLFAYEIARYVFGADAEFRRKATDDRVLIAAERLLGASHSQADALRRAGDMQRPPIKE